MTEKDNKIVNFLSYIKTPLSEQSINILYSTNNVRYDKCQLFSDYIQSLLITVFDTYMGDDIMDEEDRIEHFKWCWQKNNGNFKEEGIVFGHCDEAQDYFLEFMTEVFYSVKGKKDKPHIQLTIRSLWMSIFSYNKIKTRSDVDNFIDIYTILDKSLRKG